jgi:glycosyltransferase involved in cell wall biosynthesis
MPRSIHYPCIDPKFNPYNKLLIEALNFSGYQSESCNSITYLFLRVFSRSVSVVHFHWLDRAGGSFSLQPLKLFWQLSILILIVVTRLHNIKIVWTVHNINTHNSDSNALIFYKTVSVLVHTIISHSPSACQLISHAYHVKSEKVVFIPHGYYPMALSVKPRIYSDTPRQQTLRIIYFGNLSPYKGLDTLISALNMICSPQKLQPIVTIVGGLNEHKYPTLLADLQSGPNVTVIPKFVDYSTLNSHLNNSDIVILPFKDTLTSGSLIYALTSGRPVIVSNISSLTYYLSPSFAFTFIPGDVMSLAHVLDKICTNSIKSDLGEMGRCAREFALSLDWTAIALQTVKLYQSNARVRLSQ